MSNKTSLSRFSVDIAKFKKIPLELADTAARKIAFEIHAGLTNVTPVKTGRAKGNWFPSVGTPSEEITDGITPQPFNIDPAPLEKIWITNNLPYIVPLNEGSSQQAPTNFVELEVERVLSPLK